jgi:hypothetical protein
MKTTARLQLDAFVHRVRGGWIVAAYDGWTGDLRGPHANGASELSAAGDRDSARDLVALGAKVYPFFLAAAREAHRLYGAPCR